MMIDLSLPTLAAIDVRSALTIAMLIIAFVMWIVKQVAAAKEAAPPTVRPRRPANDPLQNEIEAFLREAGGRPNQRPEEPAIEVVSDEEIVRRERSRANAGRQSGQRPPRRPSGQRPPERSPGTARQQAPKRGVASSTTSSSVGTTPLGSGVRSHLQEYMETQRVSESVQRHLSGGLQQQLGTSLDSSYEVTPASGQHPLAKWIRGPENMRRAIVIQEILTPRYKSIRRR